MKLIEKCASAAQEASADGDGSFFFRQWLIFLEIPLGGQVSGVRVNSFGFFRKPNCKSNGERIPKGDDLVKKIIPSCRV
jgi:hypothetical protein